MLLAAHAAWAAERLDSPKRTEPSRGATLQEDDDEVEGGGIDTVYTTDTDHFRSYRLRVGALVHYESPYDLIAVGGGGTYYKQGDWSKERYTLAAAMRKLERGPGAGIVATAG